MDFSETIAFNCLKIGRCRQLIRSIKIREYSRSRSFLALRPKQLTYENLNLILSQTTGPFLSKCACKLLCAWDGLHYFIVALPGPSI